jgi:hypothetical protein
VGVGACVKVMTVRGVGAGGWKGVDVGVGVEGWRVFAGGRVVGRRGEGEDEG